MGRRRVEGCWSEDLGWRREGKATTEGGDIVSSRYGARAPWRRDQVEGGKEET